MRGRMIRKDPTRGDRTKKSDFDARVIVGSFNHRLSYTEVPCLPSPFPFHLPIDLNQSHLLAKVYHVVVVTCRE